MKTNEVLNMRLKLNSVFVSELMSLTVENQLSVHQRKKKGRVDVFMYVLFSGHLIGKRRKKKNLMRKIRRRSRRRIKLWKKRKNEDEGGGRVKVTQSVHPSAHRWRII